jgi:hypothetical protein
MWLMLQRNFRGCDNAADPRFSFLDLCESCKMRPFPCTAVKEGFKASDVNLATEGGAVSFLSGGRHAFVWHKRSRGSGQ